MDAENMDMPKKDRRVSFRTSDDGLAKIDQLASMLTKEIGLRITRAGAVEVAISEAIRARMPASREES